MCRKNDIYMAVLNEDNEGCLQSGHRPVLIVSNDKANEFSPVITVIPLTSKLNKKKLPTHVYMKSCGLERPSVALTEQITSINKSSLTKRVGSIEQTSYERKIKSAIAIQLAI